MRNEPKNNAADDQLFQQEASLLILQNVQDSYILLDKNCRIVFFNTKAVEAIQTFRSVGAIRGISFFELVDNDRKEIVKGMFDRVLQGEVQTSELELASPNGNHLYIENTFLPAYGRDTEVEGIIVHTKVINEKKKSEKIIKESEERLQFALEAAHQGAWDWNLQTNEVIYSDSYKKLYGFTEHELKNDISEWMNRIHPDDRKKMENVVHEHLNSHNRDHDSRYRIKDGNGEYRWIMAKGRLVSFDSAGKPLRMIGTHTDVTETVQQEDELKQINERFDNMMAATHEALWEWDLQNNIILRPNEGFTNVFDQRPGNTIDLEEWFSRVHPDDQHAVKKQFSEVLLAPHHFTFEMEYRLRQKNKDYMFVYDRGILLKNKQGIPVKIIGAAQDISERKRLEKELLRTELEYQRRLHQATIDSQEKERAEIGKELHDNVNQVLTTTKLYLDLALTNNELKEELISKSLRNINNVIQEIRLLSRSLMDPSIGDLGLIDSIRDLVENIHLTQKITIRFDADQAVEKLLDDKQKLTIFRIIQESLSNTLRHAQATTMEIDLNLQENNLTLTIEDNGVGFNPDEIKKGAGLKNIQNRIYLINGTLHLNSNPQQGCRIQLQFPIKNTS